MKHNKCSLYLFGVLFFNSLLSFAQISPYAGQQHNAIKSLPSQEIQQYLNGGGMGYAKIAELNGYPGPKHVLELENELRLTEQQKKETTALMQEMYKKAKPIGKKIVAQEKKLNELFESRKINLKQLADLINEISQLQGQYRFVHVETHLEMEKLLTKEQIKKYNILRGYS
jgi:Spy/CpxP family protein refolding chaperone